MSDPAERRPFYIAISSNCPIGRVHPLVVEAMTADNALMNAMLSQQAWNVQKTSVSFSDEINEGGFEARSEQIDRFVRILKESGRFKDLLAGLTEHSCDVIGTVRTEDGEDCSKMVVCEMERAALPLFGIEESV